MKLEIQKERDTPLLSRKRITALVDYEGPTPSRKQLAEAISKKLDISRDLTIVKHIYPKFGKEKAKVIAHVYSKKDDKNAVEKEYLLKKHIFEEPKKKDPAAEAIKAAAPKEAKAEEAPKAEEKKEEPKEAPKAEEKKEEVKPEAPAEEKKE